VVKEKAMKKRWRVELEAECEDDEVEAATKEEAIKIATRRVENSGEGLYVVHATATEIPYVRPSGTDRWAPVAEEIRFAEGMHRWLDGDGCWWWTDGHIAVRCDGTPPADDIGRKVANEIESVVGDHRRDRITWEGPNDDGRMVAKTDKRVQVSADYVRLVESGCPGVEWLAVEGDHDEPWKVPVIARTGGELVAVLMGMRP
jgi:hypothetical protein